MIVVRGLLLLFLLFLSYSVLGYIVEILFCSIDNKKVVLNRGFLLGPYLPIYGVGAILITFLLYRYRNDLVALFVMGAVLCSIIEYFTSLIMEKIFKIRWWDYSHMQFNLNGRICLFNSCMFGLGGIVIMKIINPFYMRILDGLSNFWIIIIGSILGVVFFSDVVISIVTLIQLKLNSNMFISKDATEEVKRIIRQTLSKKTFFVSRILNAFPKITLINNEQLKEFNDFIEHIRRERKKEKRKKERK